MPFTCSICGEESTRICVRCTKDACNNHICEKCLRCSDCCECEVVLSEPVHENVRMVRTMVDEGLVDEGLVDEGLVDEGLGEEVEEDMKHIAPPEPDPEPHLPEPDPDPAPLPSPEDPGTALS